MGAPERRHGPVRSLCGESESGSSAHTNPSRVGWLEANAGRAKEL